MPDDPIVNPIAPINIDAIETQSYTSVIRSSLTEYLSEQQILEDGNLYLSLILSIDQQVLIPSHQVVEIISVAPIQITPIPQVEMPIMGIYSWRGEILWVVDGASLLGDVALCDRHFWSPRYSVFVVRDNGEHIGIMVPDVGNLGKRSRFCSHADPPIIQSSQTASSQTASSQTASSQTEQTDPIITCPPIVDLVDRIGELRHQLRATWN